MYQILRNYLTQRIDVSDEQLTVFFGKFKSKTTKRNEILLEAGDICRHMYFVNKGCLRIYLIDEDGRESTRFLAPEGRFGTAFPSFILQEPSKAAIQSIEASEILFITYKDFRELPIFCRNGRSYTALISKRIISTPLNVLKASSP